MTRARPRPPAPRQVVIRVALLAVVSLCGAHAPALAQAPVGYRLSFDDREHRLMDVELTLRDLPEGPLQLLMSRASPGRYALHEFAKNVFAVQVTDAAGAPLAVTRPNPHEWDVPQHGGVVRVRYRIYGDRIDGTYLSIDWSHAHINMPAALMWARGLERRPITVRFEAPTGTGWRVATQLFATDDPQTFTAPTLQYLMDSPTELSAFSLRTFTIADGDSTPTFRLAAHHTGTDGELDAIATDAQRIVREARSVFGEFPAFESNTYTFIADWLPWASRDGMEHRNSTIVTSPGSIRDGRADLLDAMSHEFFHAWNVERIRPRSLEPFNFEDQNISGELWLAEGFTNYYGPLILQRAGLTQISQFAGEMGAAINTVLTAPGRQVRTAEEMSQMAAFVDAATAIDRTALDNTFISYYTWGSAIALGLDLTLRVQTDHRVTLDTLMRALWRDFGKPGGSLTGYVDRPYTMDDVRVTLGRVMGSTRAADDFIARYVRGHEALDYATLLSHAGLVWRPVAPNHATFGLLSLEDAGMGVRIAAAAPFGSPAYAAGLDRDDVILTVGGTAVTDPAGLLQAVASHRPGASVMVTYDRRGERRTTTVMLGDDLRGELVPVEDTGGTLTADQRRFRNAWLSSGERNTF